MASLFFSSDHHWGHANVIEFCNRPFKSVGEMDEVMIQRWNKVVRENDFVYHLGDMTLGNADRIKPVIERLRGQIFILGNHWHHDKRWLKHANGMGVTVLLPIHILQGAADVPVVMCHYPFEEWDRKHYGAIHLHGHSHGRLPKVERRVDVGVDSWNFYPVSLEEIIETVKG